MILKNSKSTCKLLAVFAILFFSFQFSFAQDNATISLLRPKQSMMSGGAGFTVQVYLNDVKIDNLSNAMAINYSLLSEGKVTLKFQKEGMGSLMGAPKIIQFKVEKGNTYYYLVEAKMNSLNVEAIDEKKAAKLKKKSKNFEATLDLKEEKDNLIIKE